MKHQDWVALARRELDSLGPDEIARAGLQFPGDQFWPTVYYPPITMFPPARVEDILSKDESPFNTKTYSAYVHIPFCFRRCAYCHWVLAVGTPEGEVDDYLGTLAMEMDLARRRLGVDRIPVSTALYGGGTPTYLTPRQMERVLRDFHAHYDLGACTQFSFEVEPKSILGDDGFEKLKIMRSYGVNRVCIGAQSFDDRILRHMGRPHDAADTLAAVQQAYRAGMESVSLDLIYGFPDQTVEDWIATLETTVSSGANAWHLLRLRIERYGDIQGTIKRHYRQAPEAFPAADTVQMMKMLSWVISEQNGFGQHIARMFGKERRHVSEFTRDYTCRLTNVVGVGPSGWSNYHRCFTQNIGEDMKGWSQCVRSGKIPVNRGLYRDIETETRRSFITPLKNEHVDKKKFFERTGLRVEEHFGAEMERLAPLGLIEDDGEHLRLTRRGQFFGDQTVIQFYQKRYNPFPELVHELMPE